MRFCTTQGGIFGPYLITQWVAKGSKVDAVLSMPQPHDPSSLKSFLGSVQFYNKFLPNLATITEPLYMLTRKNVDWRWGDQQESAFIALKEMLSTDVVLAHFDPSLPIGISCAAVQSNEILLLE